MQHKGKAAQAARRILLLSLTVLVVVLGCASVAMTVGQLLAIIGTGLAVLWVVFAGFVVSFFRDPSPKVPSDPAAVVAPAHGTVDVIDELEELEFMGGRCRRISIFLSVFDVHVQYAPAAGKIVFLRNNPGQFMNAMRPDSAQCNENVLVGLASTEREGEKVGVRLIAGLIARRIVPWISAGDSVGRGERISLIQFGSRVDLYLPPDVRVVVKLGDRVRGGETVLAIRD